MIHPVIIAPAVIDQRYHFLFFSTTRIAATVFVNPTSKSTSPGIKNSSNGVGFRRSRDSFSILPSGFVIIIIPQITEVIPTAESSISKMIFMTHCLDGDSGSKKVSVLSPFETPRFFCYPYAEDYT